MTDRDYDLQSWLEPYREGLASIARAQQEGFRTLEGFMRFHHAVAGDLLEAGLAHFRTTFGTRTSVGTQVIGDLMQRQAELGTDLTERLKTRAQEFSALATEAQESASSLAAETATRARATANRAARRVKRANAVRGHRPRAAARKRAV